MFYLLHGDDEFTSREQLKKLRRQGNFEYNQDTFNGGEVGLATITATCNTLPFLADQRLVVVEGLPKKRPGSTLAERRQEATTNISPEDSRASDKERIAKNGKAKKSKKGSTESRAGFEKSL